MASSSSAARPERDSMGSIEVPADAYYGASTQRAVLNFPISDLRFPRTFIRALGLIKAASARVNVELRLLDGAIGQAVARAAQEVAGGDFDDQFIVDIFQTGSGTSTNMNANEVIANRASELLGGERGSRLVHPNDHVNLGQSSNDVIPTAMHVAALLMIDSLLQPALERLRGALGAKAEQFTETIKTARTHLQDATPIRLGQEFQGYSGQLEYGLHALGRAREALSHVALGGTAVGTGVNSHPEFAAGVTRLLREWTQLNIRETDNHFQAQSTLDAVVETSGIVRAIAISLAKIADDIRWMGSGPRAGLGEIVLPAVQPGSSLMPGKVNPVIAESLLQVTAQVIGNDAAIAVAAQGGHFELNTMLPVAAYNLLQAISLLAASADNFSAKCVEGLTATLRGPALVERGLGMATALTPFIGYDAAAAIAAEAANRGQSIREVAGRRASLSADELDRILDPRRLLAPDLGAGPAPAGHG